MRIKFVVFSILFISLELLGQWNNVGDVDKNSNLEYFQKIQFLNENIGYASSANRDFFVKNGSTESWKKYELEMEYSSIRDFHFVNEQKGFIVGSTNFLTGERVLLKTEDGGKNWIKQDFGSGSSLEIIKFLNEDYGIIYSDEYDNGTYKATVFITKDGGQNWESSVFYPSWGLNSIDILDENIAIGVGNGNAIYKTVDGGKTWYSIESGLSASSLSTIKFINNTTCIAFVANFNRYIISNDLGETWTTKTLPESFWGTNDAFILDDSKWILVGREGQILRTNDAGANWTFLRLNHFPELYSISFVNSNEGYICGEKSTIAYSNDFFETWSYTYPANTTFFNKISFYDSDFGAIIGRYGTFLNTSNGGASWQFQQTNTLSDITDIQFISKDTIFVVGGTRGDWSASGIILASFDGGVTWQQKYLSNQKYLKSIAFNKDRIGYACGQPGLLLRTDDLGETWITETSMTASELNKIRFISDSVFVATGTVGRLIRKNIISGALESSRKVDNEISDFYFINKNQGWLVEVDRANGNKLYNTNDGGLTWDEIYQFVSWTEELFFINEDEGWISGDPIYHTNDGGLTWNEQTASNRSKSIFMINSEVGFAVDYHAILKTINGGGISTPVINPELISVTEGPFLSGEENNSINLEYDFEISKYEISNNEFVKFLNQWWEWNWSSYWWLDISADKMNLVGKWSGDEFKPSGKYLFYKVESNLTEVSQENIYFDGEKFVPPEGKENHPVTNVTWYGAQACAEFYKSALPTANEWEKSARGNDGRLYSWGDDVDSSYGNFLTNAISGTKPIGYYNGENGTTNSLSPYGLYDMSGNVTEWTYTSGATAEIFGGSWADLIDTSQVWKHQTKDLNYTSNTLGFRIVKGSEVVGVKELEKTPSGFSLSQNYPNPFNPSTVLRYDLPQSGAGIGEIRFVSLKVYDVLGKEVATLVNKEQSAGSYEVEFVASGLSSGVYFYTLRVGSFVETKKMLLLR